MNGTKRRLIECGIRAIMEKSYNGAGIQHILSAAGVPKGSFYHHFRSKEDFAVAVVEHFGEAHAEQLRSALGDGSRAPRARLVGYFDSFRVAVGRPGPIQQCVVAKVGLEVAAISPRIRAAIQQALASWQAILAECIREAQRAGEIDPGHHPESLAGFLYNAWEGTMIRMQIERSALPLEDFIRFVFHELLPARVN